MMTHQTVATARLRLTNVFEGYFKKECARALSGSYQSFSSWDSIGHIQLIQLIEDEFELDIPIQIAARLVTFDQLLAFVEQSTNPVLEVASLQIGEVDLNSDKVSRGLNGVILDETLISEVNGLEGRLTYRGYRIEDVATEMSSSEVMSLLLIGQNASETEIEMMHRELSNGFSLSEFEKDLITMLIARPSEDILIACLASLHHPVGKEIGFSPAASAFICGKMMAIVAHIASVQGRAEASERDEIETDVLSAFHAKLIGRTPTAEESHALKLTFALQAEHGCNASTLAVRTAVGAGASLVSAITAGISVFRGDLHGGAIIESLRMMKSIGQVSKVEGEVEYRLSEKKSVYGFGHRIYKTVDPRARLFRSVAASVSGAKPSKTLFEIAEALELHMDRLGKHGHKVNVDLYGGLAIHACGVTESLIQSLFICHRAFGWCAHALEQKSNNILIRPQLKYVGVLID